MSETAAAAVTRQVDGRIIPVAGTWTADPAHSSFEFVARHLMAKVRGRFTSFTGTVRIAEVPEESSAEFFEIEKHPKRTFRSSGVRPGPNHDGHWLLDGELTIIGNTRLVTWDVE